MLLLVPLSSFDIVCALGGVVAGAAGAAPLLVAVIPVLHGAKRAGIGRGMVAIAISTALLAGAGALVWMLLRKCFLTFAVGMVVGYFAMLALMTALALRRP